jgi:hypothetical protein
MVVRRKRSRTGLRLGAGIPLSLLITGLGILFLARPTDLTQHAIPGIHTDCPFFEWVTNGFPGSRMPAFKSTLSDTERWHLVNFIRSLAPK